MPHHKKLILHKMVMLTTLLCISITASPHGGGLNPLGCHIDNIHGGYHCHYKGGSSVLPGSASDVASLLSANVTNAESSNAIYVVSIVLVVLFLFIFVKRRSKRSERVGAKVEKNEPSSDRFIAQQQTAISKWKSNITIWHFSIPLIAVLSAFTVDRLIHFIWAIVMLYLAIKIVLKMSHKNNNMISVIYLEHVSNTHATIMALIVLYFGSWLPDVDWLIYSHRNPLIHSVIPVVLVWYFVVRSAWGNKRWNTQLLPIFSCGFASHLMADVPTKGNVVWVPAEFDIPFLAINALCCFIIALLQFRKYAINGNRAESNIDALALDDSNLKKDEEIA